MQTITKAYTSARVAFPFVAALMLLPYASCAQPKLHNEPATRPVLEAPAAGNRSVHRLAFGSCNEFFAAQPLWQSLRAATPDLFVWTGDIVYADLWVWPALANQGWLRFPGGEVSSEAQLRGAYARQKDHAAYRGFVRTLRAGVLGIYDDHDFGKNNGGREFPLRDAAQRALLDFLDVPEDAARRHRPGAYAAYDFPIAVRNGDFVRFILLDTRYHRDARPESEADATAADILGAAQWAWLEDQLRGSRASAHVIVSSIQVVAEQHRYEKWANYPAAHRRLQATLDRYRPRGLLLISGDRHLAEISQSRTPGGLTVTDVTSSGMTHSVPENWSEENRHRIGALYGGLNFGVLEFRRDALIAQIRDHTNAAVLEIIVPY